MPNFKEVRIRIASVLSTKNVTSAMKMISVAKLRKAQKALLQLRPYANKMSELLSSLSDNVSDAECFKFFNRNSNKKILLVILTSNRGLCGSFNSNIIKATNSYIKTKFSDQFNAGNLSFITIGKKSFDYYKKQYSGKILANYIDIVDKLNFNDTIPISESLIKYYLDGTFDQIYIIYNKFKNAAVQAVTLEQYLPIPQLSDYVVNPSITQQPSKIYSDYIYDPDKNEILNVLVPRSLKIQFYKCLADSVTSEHGSRLTAMSSATDNADELYNSLKLAYNKARQQAITNEILEIVSGANALKENNN